MKFSDSPSKIIGLTLGEASLNLIRIGEPPIKAKFVLINKESEVVGYLDFSSNWSEKVQDALRTFSAVLEEEVMKYVFDEAQPSETSKNDAPEEPTQF